MKVRIAIQNKGRLREPSLDFLRSLGLDFEESSCLITKCSNANVELLSVRNADIPVYVEKGAADLGIAGRNVLVEGKFDFELEKPLGFGRCSLVIAGPQGLTELEGERIATSYPNSLKQYLDRERINASIVEIKGSVEIAPALNLADAVCDITQSGRTLQQNNLLVMDTVLDSEACLISKYKKNYEKIFS